MGKSSRRRLGAERLGKLPRRIAQIDNAIRFNGKLIPLHFEATLFALPVSDIDRATVSYYRIMALDDSHV